MDQENITGSKIHNVFILSPEEWPVLVVLRIVWLQHQNTGNNAPRDEGKVSAIHAVGHFFRTSADCRNQRKVVCRVCAVEEIQSAQHGLAINQIREGFVQIIIVDGVADYPATACPPTGCNRYAKGIFLVQLL